MKARFGEEAGEWVSEMANWDQGVCSWASFVAMAQGQIARPPWLHVLPLRYGRYLC